MRRRPSASALSLAIACHGCLLLVDPPTFSDSPESGWVDVVMQYSSDLCALHEDGSLWCRDYDGLQRVGSGTYVSIGTGDQGACAVRDDGLLVCGFESSYSGFELEGPFVEVSGGNKAGCALHTNGSAQCWPEANRVNGPFSAVGAGGRFACGILASSSRLGCWSIDSLTFEEALDAPAGTYRQVTTRDHVGCALHTNGAITCWGRDFYGITGTLSGNYVDLAITANGSDACAVRSDGAVVCWGKNAGDPSHTELRPPTDVAFTRIALGSGAACGITDDTRLLCWGE